MKKHAQFRALPFDYYSIRFHLTICPCICIPLSLLLLTGCWNHEPAAKSVLQTNGQICSSTREKNKTYAFSAHYGMSDCEALKFHSQQGAGVHLLHSELQLLKYSSQGVAFDVALLSARKEFGLKEKGASAPRSLKASSGSRRKDTRLIKRSPLSNMKRALF